MYSDPRQSSPGYTRNFNPPPGVSEVLCTTACIGKIAPARTYSGTSSNWGCNTRCAACPSTLVLVQKSYQSPGADENLWRPTFPYPREPRTNRAQTENCDRRLLRLSPADTQQTKAA